MELNSTFLVEDNKTEPIIKQEILDQNEYRCAPIERFALSDIHISAGQPEVAKLPTDRSKLKMKTRLKSTSDNLIAKCIVGLNDFLVYEFTRAYRELLESEVENTKYHRESNVWVHTLAVFNATVANVHQNLHLSMHPSYDLLVAGMAAMFHDVNKPLTQSTKVLESGEQVSQYLGHEVQSAREWVHFSLHSNGTKSVFDRYFGDILQSANIDVSQFITDVYTLIAYHLPFNHTDDAVALAIRSTKCSIVAWNALWAGDRNGRISEVQYEPAEVVLQKYLDHLMVLETESDKIKDNWSIVDNNNSCLTICIMSGSSSSGKSYHAKNEVVHMCKSQFGVKPLYLNYDDIRIEAYTEVHGHCPDIRTATFWSWNEGAAAYNALLMKKMEYHKIRSVNDHCVVILDGMHQSYKSTKAAARKVMSKFGKSRTVVQVIHIQVLTSFARCMSHFNEKIDNDPTLGLAGKSKDERQHLIGKHINTIKETYYRIHPSVYSTPYYTKEIGKLVKYQTFFVFNWD